MNSVAALVDPIVRDLWWAVTGPGLMDGAFCALAEPHAAEALLPAFTALEANPERLHAAVGATLAAERLRLGTYFEELIRFFVTDVLGHRDARSGVVISENKRTIGELDLLFRDRDASYHWELAVKFYLHVPNLTSDPFEGYVGPQTRDRLHLKMARVRDHQLPLAQHAAAERIVAPWKPLQSAAFVKGRLFYPVSSDWRNGRAGTSIASDHSRGWWCAVDQARDSLPEADAYALLTRREWFAPVATTASNVTPWSRDEVLAWCAEAAATWPVGTARSYVVAGLDSEGEETHRGFLVSLGWPGRGVTTP